MFTLVRHSSGCDRGGEERSESKKEGGGMHGDLGELGWEVFELVF
jgi:hypothetical protein